MRKILATEQERMWYKLKGVTLYRACKAIHFRTTNGSWERRVYDTDIPKKDLRRRLSQ